MRNNIAPFEKTSCSRVKIMEKINEEFIFALKFAQNITQLLLVFSKEAILFLIYLQADKAIVSLYRLDICVHITNNLNFMHNHLLKTLTYFSFNL